MVSEAEHNTPVILVGNKVHFCPLNDSACFLQINDRFSLYYSYTPFKEPSDLRNFQCSLNSLTVMTVLVCSFDYWKEDASLSDLNLYDKVCREDDNLHFWQKRNVSLSVVWLCVFTLSLKYGSIIISLGWRCRLLNDGLGSSHHERVLRDRDLRRVLGSKLEKYFWNVLFCAKSRSAPVCTALELSRKRCKFHKCKHPCNKTLTLTKC